MYPHLATFCSEDGVARESSSWTGASGTPGGGENGAPRDSVAKAVTPSDSHCTVSQRESLDWAWLGNVSSVTSRPRSR